MAREIAREIARESVNYGLAPVEDGTNPLSIRESAIWESVTYLEAILPKFAPLKWSN